MAETKTKPTDVSVDAFSKPSRIPCAAPMAKRCA
jgi:hypothetical protein